MNAIDETLNMDKFRNNSINPPTQNSSYSAMEIVAIATSVTAVWVLVVFGNGLVIAAIFIDRRLKGVQNWFLASLGFADFLLGLLILPLSLVKEILGYWVFGRLLCSLWLAIDVLLCTASIMNLCLISLDRYWSVTAPLTYVQARTPKRACIMIASVWIISAGICLPPLLGWNKPQPTGRVCELTSDIGYVLYSSIGSFYIPLTIIIIVYAKVFYEARKRLHKRPGGNGVKLTSAKPSVNIDDHDFEVSQQPPPESNLEVVKTEVSPRQSLPVDSPPKVVQNSLTVCCEKNGPLFSGSCRSINNNNNDTPCHGSTNRDPRLSDATSRMDSPRKFGGGCLGRKSSRSLSTSERKESTVYSVAEKKKRLMKSRERRATLVLGIILGAFITCWFPFFTTYIIDILCGQCVNKILFGFFFWMGYCNSALNPIIYTVFNRDFRLAFQKILFFQKHI